MEGNEDLVCCVRCHFQLVRCLQDGKVFCSLGPTLTGDNGFVGRGWEDVFCVLFRNSQGL